ncbi:MAG: DNA gyrase subunit A [Hydrogenophilales bacterium 12-64-13]|nr:MAG: DNA gyrase subunit A [Hydrogenophilales bacterium 12-64-13]
MEQFAKETLPVSLEEEMRRSYLDYAMSVIVGRALPDVRDGLKPVHRRVLFAMNELSNDWNKAYKKSARVVGDVIGKYHPHGDTAVYDTMVRMAQDFSLRYPLIDGQGNFGSVDGDNAAAMRYTEVRMAEVRMAKIAHELLADLDKETVDFGPNYDGSEQEPLVLPTKIPNLLINGSSGIAVGMATNIPPHNLTDICTALFALLEDPEIDIESLISIVKAPDFPTAGIIYGLSGVRDGYRTGRGRVVMRATCHIEDVGREGGKQAIIIDELPYQVNKANLLIKIGELVREKQIDGISDLRDESDKSGMRVYIELKRGENADVILNNLYKQTQMQDTFGMNMVALIDGQPRLLNLKEMLDAFLRHRREVVTRRTVFDLRKARERGHILEGLAVALANVDEIVELIKSSETPVIARERLLGRAWKSAMVEEMLARIDPEYSRPVNIGPEFGLHADGYRLSEIQAQRILEMQLQRLTNLESDKIIGEYKEIMAKIADLLDILANPSRITQIIRDELKEIQDQFGDARRSAIVENAQDMSMEDLIKPEEMVVTLSHGGYMKSQPMDDYRAQKRGGRGKQAAGTKDEDFIEKMFIANTHDYILCFSNRGRLYWLKVYNVPAGGRAARGKPIVNLLPLEDGEKINALLPVKTFDDEHYVFMATSNGIVKKTPLSEFSRPRTAGIIAVGLDDGDFLIGASITDGRHDVMLFSDGGKAVRFDENDVRPMGRTARGVIGMKLAKGRKLISLLVAEDENDFVLTATENGFGKRTPITEYTRHARATQGMIAIQTSERNGRVVAATLVKPDDEIMLITTGGVLIRTRVKEIRAMSRATQGVTLINLDKGETLISLEKVAETDNEEDLSA